MPSKLQQRKLERRTLNEKTSARNKDYLKERRQMFPKPTTRKAEGLKGALAKVQTNFNRVIELTEQVKQAYEQTHKLYKEWVVLNSGDSKYQEARDKYIAADKVRYDIEGQRDDLKREIFLNSDRLEREIEVFFKAKYGNSFFNIISALNRPGTTGIIIGRDTFQGLSQISLVFRDIIFDRSTLKQKSNDPQLIVFPLLGSMFNYLFAKGLLTELQKRGLGKNIKLVTLKVSSGLEYHGFTREQMLNDLNSQVDTLIKQNPGIKNVAVFDFVSGETTRNLLKDVFESKVKGAIVNHYLIGDHQQIDSGPKPTDVYAKLVSPEGKQIVVKREDVKKLMEQGYKYYHFGSVRKELPKEDRPKSIAETTELLHVIGRLYYYTDFIKDVLRLLY